MIATVDFYGTTTGPTGCLGRSCFNCTMDCHLVVIYATTSTRTSLEQEESRYASSLTREKWPDKAPEREYDIPVDYEELSLWRKEIRVRSRYKNPFNHKPSLKRRTLFSKSGWLARKGRLRKKGKK